MGLFEYYPYTLKGTKKLLGMVYNQFRKKKIVPTLAKVLDICDDESRDLTSKSFLHSLLPLNHPPCPPQNTHLQPPQTPNTPPAAAPPTYAG